MSHEDEKAAHEATHLPQMVELSRSLAAMMGGNHNIVECALIVRLGCGFEATLTFSSAGESFDPVRLMERALEETKAMMARRGAAALAPPPGSTIQ